MKIQENLVWDKHSGELIAFADLGDININYAILEIVQKLGTYVLVFLVKSVANPLSYSFRTFATDGITDGVSQNTKFFRMHKYLCGDSDADIIYRSKNIQTKEMRFIYFFADAPHLVKTFRNCLYHSGSGPGTRYIWNNGFFLLWSHIACLYYEDLESGLKFVNKLTSDHKNLTCYCVMRVNLAAQVLSETVGNVLNNFGPEEAEGTGQFCMMDKFFDCLKVQNTKEHIIKRKPF